MWNAVTYMLFSLILFELNIKINTRYAAAPHLISFEARHVSNAAAQCNFCGESKLLESGRVLISNAYNQMIVCAFCPDKL